MYVYSFDHINIFIIFLFAQCTFLLVCINYYYIMLLRNTHTHTKFFSVSEFYRAINLTFGERQ